MEFLINLLGLTGLGLVLGSIVYFLLTRKKENYSKRNFITILGVGLTSFVLAMIFTASINPSVSKDNQQLTATNKNLVAENKQFKSEIVELKGTNADLTAKALETETQLEDLTKQFAEITGQNQELHTKNEELAAQNQELKEKNQQLTASANTTSSSSNNSTVSASSSEQHNVETMVYWTPNGDKYHSTSECRTLSRSKTILSGTISNSHRTPCAVCH